MKTRQKLISELLRQAIIEQLALPSNLQYGTAIYERGAVEIIEQSPHHIEGWAGGLDGTMVEGGGQRRRVKLSSTPKGLAWHCAGNPKNHQIFCKHCVALALALAHGNK
ncbi:MAG TPA: hypothetical protein VLF39_00040 [Candidatus Saccharimonadales bacterium]|nr:hypothetical protein [Candidatus Saccharimonadales bacterium]